MTRRTFLKARIALVKVTRVHPWRQYSIFLCFSEKCSCKRENPSYYLLFILLCFTKHSLTGNPSYCMSSAKILPSFTKICFADKTPDFGDRGLRACPLPLPHYKYYTTTIWRIKVNSENPIARSITLPYLLRKWGLAKQA